MLIRKKGHLIRFFYINTCSSRSENKIQVLYLNLIETNKPNPVEGKTEIKLGIHNWRIY